MTAILEICFHGIGSPDATIPGDEAAYWIAADTFRAVLDLVAGRDGVRLSFDDGCASDVEVALPELVARGVGATFFPLAGRFGAAGSLSPDDVRALSAAGMTIGSHGMRHVPWRGLDQAALHRELVEARDVIAEVVGLPVTEAACPLGRYDRRVLAALRRAGYRAVYTSDRAVTRQGAWLRPRFSVRATDDASSVEAMLQHGTRRLTRMKDAARIAVKRLR